MFTGLVSGTVRVYSLKKRGRGMQLSVKAPPPLRSLPLGSSLALDGVCVTVSAKRNGMLFFDLIRETLRRTTLGKKTAGSILNWERPLRVGQRLEGHLVQGHVEGTARVLHCTRQGKERSLILSAPRALRPRILAKGSVALNGVSLTVGRTDRARFQVHLVPHTLKKTNLAHAARGTRLNLETDSLLKGRRRVDNPHKPI